MRDSCGGRDGPPLLASDAAYFQLNGSVGRLLSERYFSGHTVW
jgi:hypothetical protein